MYPRVKVRDQADHVAVQEDATSYILRVIETLSIEDHRSPKVLVSSQANERRNDLQSSHARIANSRPRNSPVPTVSTSKGKGNKSIDEDNRTNIRASPVPRPRAVLSSPDNDGIIGSQNQRSRERAALRKHTLNNDGKIGKQNQQIEEETLPKRQTPSRIALVQGKATSRRVKLESPLPVRAVRVSRDAANSSQPKDRQASEVAAPRLRIPIARG